MMSKTASSFLNQSIIRGISRALLMPVILSTTASLGATDRRGEVWEADLGPNPETAVGRGYAEIFAKTPNYREIGQVMLGGKNDKFRWKFGPMFYRGRLGENEVQVLIIGQEGAQDENISDRSFTGGTGGRMQHFLSYLGLNRSYLFVNTFAYTITGQYAEFAPYIENPGAESERLKWGNVMKISMFQLAQDERSPIVSHRHELLDHVIASNKKSLRLIVAVGGAAQDTLATYIQSRGGSCEPAVTSASKIQLVKYASESAGGNKKFYYPTDDRRKNLLLSLLDEEEQSSRKIRVKGTLTAIDWTNADVQNEFKARATRSAEFRKELVRLEGGKVGNGIDHLGQFGWNLDSCKVDGEKSKLKGLRNVDTDVRYVQVMHPGSNSPKLRENFEAAMKKIASWNKEGKGWKLTPDQDSSGRELTQKLGDAFVYGRADVPRRDFRFGLPDVIGHGETNSTRRNMNKMDSGSAIEFGERDVKGRYRYTEDPKTAPDKTYQFTDVPWEPNKEKAGQLRFDYGPSEYWAKIFVGASGSDVPALPKAELYRANPTALEKFDAMAIYRGRPDHSEVLILADQTSHDDMWTGRALTGLKGQELQAFLEGIGAGLKYTILRTLPVDTMNASASDVNQLLGISRAWRTGVWNKLVSHNRKNLKLIITMGESADAEYSQHLMNAADGVGHISLTNGFDRGFLALKGVTTWKVPGMKFQPGPIPIAREDIPYGMRRWTGTTGDRVMKADGNRLYQIIAPRWATQQKPRSLSSAETKALKSMGYSYNSFEPNVETLTTDDAESSEESPDVSGDESVEDSQ